MLLQQLLNSNDYDAGRVRSVLMNALKALDELSIGTDDPSVAAPTLSADSIKKKSVGNAGSASDSKTESARPFNMFSRDEIDTRKSTLVLLVHGSKTVVGHIIGKFGSWISHLERSCGVLASVAKPSEMPPGSNERRITITGSIANCVSAQQRLLRRLHEKLQEEEFIKMVIPFESVPHLIGRSGCSIRRFQEVSHARIQIDHSAHPAPGRVGCAITIHGEQYARSMATYLILRHLSKFNLPKEWCGGRPLPAVQ